LHSVCERVAPSHSGRPCGPEFKPALALICFHRRPY
jgi:hypothetical protein